MSDEEDFEESDFDSGEDFSNSEDDWKPGKDDRTDDDDDDEDYTAFDTSDLLDSSAGGKKKSEKKSGSKQASGRKRRAKRLSLSLRAKLYRKYQPPPKTVNGSGSSNTLPVPSGISKILFASEYKPKIAETTANKKSRAVSSNESESESSGDDHLVDPNNLDFGSSFFNQTKSPDSSEKPPVFDCNAGLNLTDSEGSGDEQQDAAKNDDENDKKESKGSESVIKKINKASSEQIHDFRELHDFTKRIETAKNQLKNFKSDRFPGTQEQTDVTKLLALGEGSKDKTGTKRKATQEINSDDSDWEDVEDAVQPDATIKDVQIFIDPNLGNARRLTKDERKKIDMQACLKRKMNRRIKEKQILKHKTHLLCWIAHANRVNRKLNNTVLMQMCLNLLPSKESYPKGKVSIPYLESIAKWYKTKMALKSDNEYCNFKPLPPLTTSLALQIKKLGAICKRDFVFIFIILLRAIGIHCRLVINLPLIPIRPPQSDLYKIPVKPETDEKNSSESAEKKKKVDEKPKDVKNESKDKSKAHSSPKSEHIKSSHSSSNTKNSRSKDNANISSKSKENETATKSAKVRPESTSHDEKTNKPSSSKTSRSKESNSTSQTEARSASSSKTSKNKESPTTSKFVQAKESNDKKPEAASTSKSLATKLKEKTGSRQSEEGTRTRTARKRDIGADEGSSKKVTRNNDKEVNPKRTKLTENAMDLVEREANLANGVSVENGDKKKGRVLKVVLTRMKDIPVEIKKHKTSDSAYFNPKVSKGEVNGKDRKPSAKAKESTEKPSPKLKTITRSRAKAQFKVPQMDGADDTNPKADKKLNLRKLTGRTAKTKANAAVSAQKPSTSAKDFDDISNSDSDFAPTPPKRIKRPLIQSKSSSNKKATNKALNQSKPRNCGVMSDIDEDSPVPPPNGINYWVEVFCEEEEKWVAMNIFKLKVDNIDSVRKTASKPITYVFAWNNDNTIRDVTPRYCTQWNTVTRRSRVEKDWLDKALRFYYEPRNSRNMIEDVEFSKQQLQVPLPQTINEYKNHPLYALSRHLLKFEAIYPPDALTLGFVRNEPVYARECVHQLHSREIWVKQARVVKPGENPYKIVKARPKWDRLTNQMLEPQPLEIFGFWQTQQYEPPVAQNGIVPRNAYGNVELFKPEMLPIGTRHLQLPNLNRTCKRMNVDCAQAVIGFDFHGGSSHPTFDGFVVCEEFADEVVEQWWKDQLEAERKEKEKHEARIIGNWKKLVQGLFIRERLKRKFNFGVKKGGDGASSSKH